MASVYLEETGVAIKFCNLINQLLDELDILRQYPTLEGWFLSSLNLRFFLLVKFEGSCHVVGLGDGLIRRRLADDLISQLRKCLITGQGMGHQGPCAPRNKGAAETAPGAGLETRNTPQVNPSDRTHIT